MFRRALRSIHGHVASSQRRGFLTIAVQNGHERTEYKLTVPWEKRASPSSDAIALILSASGKQNNPRVTLKSTEKGGVIVSSDIMTANKFDSRSIRGRGRKRDLVDLYIWPQELRATATVMRTNDNSKWIWQSTWNFDMVGGQHEKNLFPLISSHKQQLHYKGFICKQIAAEFEVSIKTNFSVQQTLGRGAERKVFKCISKEGAHPCAVKRYNIRKAIADEPREPRVMKMLCHPSVKKLYIAWLEDKAGTFGKDSTVYLAQELCKCNFDDYLGKKTKGGMHNKLKLFKEIVAGLGYLHQQGVIHRDIKPSNIFLDGQNQVKIGDFGSGALIGSASCMGGRRFWGTALYASPELWHSNTHSEKVTFTISWAFQPDNLNTLDIIVYCLGIVYFELFGHFATNDARWKGLEQLQKVLNCRSWKTRPLETWLKSNVSKGWAGKPELLIRMLQRSPNRRPRCLDILLMLP